MKKLIALFLFAAVLTTAVSARDNGFNIGITPTFSVVNIDKDSYSDPSFWSIGVTGGYVLNFYNFWSFNPEVSLYTENVKHGFQAAPGGRGDKDALNFGGSVAALLCANFGAGIEACTGPVGYCNFSQTALDSDGGYQRDYNRASAYWRFGLGYTLWKFTLRAAFNLRMTKDMCATNAHTVSLGLYYNF